MNKNRDILIAQINLSIARSNWWIAYSNTSANKSRRVNAGHYMSHEYLCESELVDDAISTANNHLENAQKALEQLNVLKD